MIDRQTFVWRNAAGALALTVLTLTSGCVLGNRPTFVHGGTNAGKMTYYLDGAGNFGFGKETVPLGLVDGGYDGRIEHFIWTTYLGPLVDQMSTTVAGWRGRQLANEIKAYLDKHPGADVNIIGLSAGSGVAVFALEKLPTRCRVNNVVMLSSSLSADYDLSRALRRVQGGMYFFWSTNDPILNNFVPYIGTIDGKYTSQVAGITGAKPPPAMDRDGRALYAERVHNIPWYTNEIGGTIKLRHAGTTDRTFVRDMVAPILVRSAHRSAATASPRPDTSSVTAAPPATRPSRAP